MNKVNLEYDIAKNMIFYKLNNIKTFFILCKNKNLCYLIPLDYNLNKITNSINNSNTKFKINNNVFESLTKKLNDKPLIIEKDNITYLKKGSNYDKIDNISTFFSKIQSGGSNKLKKIRFIVFFKNNFNKDINLLQTIIDGLNNYLSKHLKNYNLNIIETPILVNKNNIKELENIFYSKNKNNIQKGGTVEGPVINNYIMKIEIVSTDKNFSSNIFNEKKSLKINDIELKFINDRNTNLNDLYSNWNNNLFASGKIVNKYVGKKQPVHRRQRFEKSVGYLKGITERLRDCTDISVAYQKKHKEVESMIVTIRKLYSLVIFLRDQIDKNQENYDTLESLILEITLAMSKDYHIPQRELIQLQNIQQKIAQDSAELEKKFRVVSNQILNRLDEAGALKEEAPLHLGPEFPSKKGDMGISDIDKFTDEQLDAVGADYYTLPKDPNYKKYKNKPHSDVTSHFKTKKGRYNEYMGIGELAVDDNPAHMIEPDPYIYNKSDNGLDGTFFEGVQNLDKNKMKNNKSLAKEQIYENSKQRKLKKIDTDNKSMVTNLKVKSLQEYLNKTTPTISKFLENNELNQNLGKVLEDQAKNKKKVDLSGAHTSFRHSQKSKLFNINEESKFTDKSKSKYLSPYSHILQNTLTDINTLNFN